MHTSFEEVLKQIEAIKLDGLSADDKACIYKEFLKKYLNRARQPQAEVFDSLADALFEVQFYSRSSLSNPLFSNATMFLLPIPLKPLVSSTNSLPASTSLALPKVLLSPPFA